jgi:hypothetical protein
MNKKKKKRKVKSDEKPLTPFKKRMSYEGGTFTPPNGKPTMTREEALRQLGFEGEKG